MQQNSPPQCEGELSHKPTTLSTVRFAQRARVARQACAAPTPWLWRWQGREGPATAAANYLPNFTAAGLAFCTPAEVVSVMLIVPR